MITEFELAFTAGLMEGEGSVRINALTKRNKGHLIVAMTNTNLELVEWMNLRWPGYCKQVSGLRPNHRAAFCWIIAARKALAFLEKISPFVVTQRMRDRIDAARWWQKIKARHWQYRQETDFQESFDCWHWMSHLNKRGVQECQ